MVRECFRENIEGSDVIARARSRFELLREFAICEQL
jgi:hypothetical protein